MKKIIPLLLVFVLAGCASIAQQKELTNQCASSRILITNLFPSNTKPSYMLPDGRICRTDEVL